MDSVLKEKDFTFLKDAIYRWSGITLAPDRIAMVESRVQRRARKLGLESLGDYIELLRSNVDEKQNFIDLMTTNKTSFFRTARIWSFLDTEMLPNWDLSKKFRCWSAACSTGEEAYSLAMVLTSFQEHHSTFDFSIDASDINLSVLGQAQSGKFSEKSIAGLKSEHAHFYTKYFVEDVADKRLSKRIRFFHQNLFESYNRQYDLILLRNVLIYFSADDQIKLLTGIQSALSPEGRLIVGESEALRRLQMNFSQTEPLIYSVGG